MEVGGACPPHPPNPNSPPARRSHREPAAEVRAVPVACGAWPGIWWPQCLRLLSEEEDGRGKGREGGSARSEQKAQPAQKSRQTHAGLRTHRSDA